MAGVSGPDMALSPGIRLGPYEILAAVGTGGMGTVYRARDTRLQRLVAIKVSHERFSERFEREAQAVAALNHPNICQLYDVGPDYLVMELIEGSPLTPVDLGPVPPAFDLADGVNEFAYRGFSLHPDGKSFLTSVLKMRMQIYIMKDFSRRPRLADTLLSIARP
jgi:serine/threonine protein kinase